jgi:hypothetical protein
VSGPQQELESSWWALLDAGINDWGESHTPEGVTGVTCPGDTASPLGVTSLCINRCYYPKDQSQSTGPT